MSSVPTAFSFITGLCRATVATDDSARRIPAPETRDNIVQKSVQYQTIFNLSLKRKGNTAMVLLEKEKFLTELSKLFLDTREVGSSRSASTPKSSLRERAQFPK